MITDDFKEILEKYWLEKKKPLKDNEFAYKMTNEFTKNLDDLVNEIKENDEEYLVKISPGHGMWSSSPYAGILNKKISNTFKGGLYIVCSFRDSSGFYLSIGQGEDNTLKKKRIGITNKLVDILKMDNIQIPDGFIIDGDKFRDDLIISKFYKKDEIEFEKFKEDLKELISIYESLRPAYLDILFDDEPSKTDLRPEKDGIRIWRIAPGERDISDEAWDDFKKEGYVGVSFERDGDCPDFSKFKNKYVFNNYLNGNAFENKSTNMLWKFVKWIKKGDIVIVNNGRSKLAGIGIITGDFIPKCENNNIKSFGLNNIRHVDWIFTPDDLEIRENFFARNTLTEFTDRPEKWNELVFTISRTDYNLRTNLLEFLYSSFWEGFLNTEKSKKHNKCYVSERKYIKNIWQDLNKKDQNGENISDDIWDKIINRDNKLYTDAARDVKTVIQNQFKYSDEDMYFVARLFFETINDLLKADKINDKKEILKRYSENKYSKGLQTGRFSPVIHYLDDYFYVINNKTIATMNLMSLILGEKLEINSSIDYYISNNEKYKNFLEKLNKIYPFDKFEMDFITFDTFCHWFVDKNLANFAGKKPNLIPPELILGYEKLPCDKLIDEYFEIPNDLNEESIDILKDLYCNIKTWKEELFVEGLSIQEYFDRQSGDISIEDLELFFKELYDVNLIKLISENPKRYDLNIDEENFDFHSINLNYNLLESKLQGFVISEDIINQTCASLNAGKHIIFDGTPGTGKTELAIKFSSVAKENKFMDGYVLTTATSDWSTFDTIGGLMPTQEGSLEFKAGKFLEAIELNKWLIIDEINRADIDKAFGQLFTVLSGQDVELPYKENGKSIKIKTWDEFNCKHDFDNATYYIGQNWRIIGTMNVDDKDSLFDLSYAFMRRFMFIEVDLPSDNDYLDIINQWSNNLDEYYQDKLGEILGIVQFRKLGPAIFKDMILYIKERDKLDSPDKDKVLGEAFNSYILPQLEGLPKNKIDEIEEFLDNLGLSDYISDKFEDLILDL